MNEERHDQPEKKRPKIDKLELNLETLQALDDEAAENVKGGLLANSSRTCESPCVRTGVGCG